jgi:Na+/H+ antiporter NhaC
MPQLGFPLLAALGLKIHCGDRKNGTTGKKFKNTLYISGGLVLLSLLIFFMSDFKSDADSRLKQGYTSSIVQQMARGKQPTPEMEQQAGQVVNGWISALREDRKGIFQADLLRSIVFVLLAAGLCWFFYRGRIKPIVLISGLLVLSSFDLFSEDRKYLNKIFTQNLKILKQILHQPMQIK